MVLEAEAVDQIGRVSSSDYGNSASLGPVDHALQQGLAPVFEVRKLEDSDGAVPEDRTRALNDLIEHF